MKAMLWNEDIVQCTPTPPFLTNSRVDMVGFVDPHKVVALRSAFFLPFNMHKLKLNWKVEQKVKGWNIKFLEWKEIRIYKRLLNQFPFQTKEQREKKKKSVEKRRWKKWKKLEIISIMCNKKTKKEERKKKSWKKQREEKKTPKINLILSHIDQTFFIRDPRIGSPACRHARCTIRKSVFLMWRRVQFEV
jgi:hypothetical protein